LATDFGVTMSMSRKGNAWDNAAMESFFKMLKVKRVHLYTRRLKLATPPAGAVLTDPSTNSPGNDEPNPFSGAPSEVLMPLTAHTLDLGSLKVDKTVVAHNGLAETSLPDTYIGVLRVETKL
jgi:transposase InsO family protein